MVPGQDVMPRTMISAIVAAGRGRHREHDDQRQERDDQHPVGQLDERSTQPPKWPEKTPSVPITIEIIADANPTNREIRLPQMIRVRTGRPLLSVPSQ